MRALVSFSLAALPDVENLSLLGSAAINATGNAGANVLAGNAGNNVLDGAGGTDTASYAGAAAAVQANLSITGAQATGAGSDTLISIERLIGSAFGKIASSFVADIMMPPLSLLIGPVDFSNRFISLAGGEFKTVAEAKADAPSCFTVTLPFVRSA